jgi:hypothetical protein
MTNCFAIRPGSIFAYKDQVWKVTRNDTLAQILSLASMTGPTQTKRIRYRAGDEINLRWTPYDRQSS